MPKLVVFGILEWSPYIPSDPKAEAKDGVLGTWL
jgi:hypothetical protein